MRKVLVGNAKAFAHLHEQGIKELRCEVLIPMYGIESARYEYISRSVRECIVIHIIASSRNLY